LLKPSCKPLALASLTLSSQIFDLYLKIVGAPPLR
jgi:hypothetical protein